MATIYYLILGVILLLFVFPVSPLNTGYVTQKTQIKGTTVGQRKRRAFRC